MDTHLAAEIAKRLPAFEWPVIAIQSLILLVVAIAGVFVGEYLRDRAKNFATKADAPPRVCLLILVPTVSSTGCITQSAGVWPRVTRNHGLYST